MAAVNDVTGDVIATKTNSEAYRSNFDAIFRKEKPVVQYKVSEGYEPIIVVGGSAYIVTVDHPNHLEVEGHAIINGELVRTSTVLSYDKETGAFETKNTKYVPEGSV